MSNSIILENQRIGIDIDDVLAQTAKAILAYMQEELQIHLSYENLTEFYWWDLPENPLDRDLVDEIWTNFWTSSFAGQIALIQESQSGVFALKQKQNTLFAITGRNKVNAEAHTLEWIKTHFPNCFEEVLFANYDHKTHEKITKSELCHSLQIKYMVEDSPAYAQDLLSNNIHTFLMERPWNKNKELYHQHLTRISGWSYFL